MFDFAWTEIALIGVVALVAIGPKDMPGAIKAVANMVKKARRMAGEFQTHVDEMVREANLDEVRNQINELRSMDVKGMVEKAVDSDGSIRQSFSNPITTAATTATPATPYEGRVMDRPAATVVPPPQLADAPAFVPPEIARRAAPAMPSVTVPEPVAPPAIPAFIPPNLGMPSYAGLGASVETTPLPAQAPPPPPPPPPPSPSPSSPPQSAA